MVITMVTKNTLLLYLISFLFMALNILFPAYLYARFVGRNNVEKKSVFRKLILYVILPEIILLTVSVISIVYLSYYLVVSRYI